MLNDRWACASSLFCRISFIVMDFRIRPGKKVQIKLQRYSMNEGKKAKVKIKKKMVQSNSCWGRGSNERVIFSFRLWELLSRLQIPNIFYGFFGCNSIAFSLILEIFLCSFLFLFLLCPFRSLIAIFGETFSYSISIYILYSSKLYPSLSDNLDSFFLLFVDKFFYCFSIFRLFFWCNRRRIARASSQLQDWKSSSCTHLTRTVWLILFIR